MADFSGLNFRKPDDSKSEPAPADDFDEFDSVEDFESESILEESVDVEASGAGLIRAPFVLRRALQESPLDENTAPSPAVAGEGEAELEAEADSLVPGVEVVAPPVVAEELVQVPAPAVPGELVSTEVDMGSDSLDLFPEDDLEDPGPVNPLLDDDEELWEGASEEISKTELIRDVTGEILDRDDLDESDFETFEGFEGGGSANPLLDDEDDYPVAVSNPLLEDDDDELEPLSESSDSSEKAPSLSELRDKIAANAEPRRFFPEGLDPEFDQRVIHAPSTKEVVAAEREGKIRVREASKSEAKEFKSEFVKKPTETVNVNELGETRTEAGKERKRLKKSGPAGKMAGKELEFFKNMGSRKSQYTEGLKTTDLLGGPLNQFATAAEKKERLERLERVFDSRVAYRSGANFILNEKMTEMLSFLALFRYATHSHLARMFGESQRTTLDRLYRMQANGLVDSRKIYAQHAIWFLTEPGLIVSGYDVRKVTDSRLTYSMFPHQFTVNHVAANLWGGKLNVLNLPDFPSKNRVNMKGVPIQGEQLTSELEILSSFAKMKLFEDSASFRPKLMNIMDVEFKKWADADRTQVPSPELIYGNEWMFTLFPPLSVGIAYHVPDLVVKRPRGTDGAPRSIAIEIEIKNKPIGAYQKTLQAYAADKRIFEKVIWVCKTIGPAKKLEKIAKELGIYQSGKLKIVPIWTNDGVFKGRDLWTI